MLEIEIESSKTKGGDIMNLRSKPSPFKHNHSKWEACHGNTYAKDGSRIDGCPIWFFYNDRLSAYYLDSNPKPVVINGVTFNPSKEQGFIKYNTETKT
jgi:hypothetical protein